MKVSKYKLDPYKEQILSWVSLGKQKKEILKLLKSNYDITVSRPTLDKYLDNLTHDFKIAKKLGEENKLMKQTEKPRRVLGQMEKLIGRTEPLLNRILKAYEDLSDEELLNNTDISKMLTNATKMYDLMGRLTGEIQTGQKIVLKFGDDSEKDKEFLEFVKYRVERELGITFNQFMEDYRRWRKQKGTDIDVEYIDIDAVKTDVEK